MPFCAQPQWLRQETSAVILKFHKMDLMAVVNISDGSLEQSNETPYLSNMNVSGIADASVLPPDMRFTEVNVIVIAIYGNLFWVSLVGNLSVFFSLMRKKKKGRVHVLLINLCIADLMTTFVEMPLKICWKYTVQWLGDEMSCRTLSVLRVFGLYLSAFLLISISIDRFLAICDPLSSIRRAGKRTRSMVFFAWGISFICAAPQAMIWQVMSHPDFPWYYQCATFGAFSTPTMELMYGISVMMLTYGFPLVIILFCYLGIWVRILYTSDHQVLIVGIFILCWSPYQIMSMWYFFDRSTAVLVNQLTQEILFIFGVSSSVLNPYVYGLYSMGIWKNLAILRAVPCLKGKFRGISRETRFSCGDNSRGLTDTESDDKSKRINHSPRNQSSFTRLTPFHSQSRWACNDVLSNSFSQNKSAVDF